MEIITSDGDGNDVSIDLQDTEDGVADLDGGGEVDSAGELEFGEAAVGRTILPPEGVADRSDGAAASVEFGCAVVILLDCLTERENWE